ncbi:MAG: hypothetical protein JRF40_05060 [Deltaproteobacteria bacterium]|nr:hypothetical protein [Deltaproteobacteria bacterium]
MMKRYVKMMFILLIGLAMGLIMSNITACGTPGSTNVHYGVNVHYRSGWGHYNHRHYHHRPPPRRVTPHRR